jgi:hypothetical protein
MKPFVKADDALRRKDQPQPEGAEKGAAEYV